VKGLFGGGPDRSGDGASGSGRGIFAGIFVASPDAVERWDMAELTPTDWPAMEFKRLETVKLGTLESILTGVDYDDIDQDLLHALVRTGGEEGPWIVRVREVLVTALAALEDGRVPTVASAWADTEEFTLGHGGQLPPREVESLAEAIAEMAALARTARQRGAPMYLLMSL
jgi:hypothetical protein